MALSAEIQVKKGLGVHVTRKKKATNFSKFFDMPPHITYTARDPNTAKRLRRLMGTNIIRMTDFDFMERLGNRTVEVHGEDLRERMDERARAAAAAAHLRLWEEVLKGRCTLPTEQLHDSCMRDVRRLQLKLERLQRKADKTGTTFQRVISQPKVWSPPVNWNRLKKLHHAKLLEGERTSQSASETRSTDASAQGSIYSSGEPCPRPSGVSQVEESTSQSRRKQLKSVEEVAERQFSTKSAADNRGQSEQEEEVTTQGSARSDRRVMPQKRQPVVFPDQPPAFCLMSTEGGKHQLGPPTNPDFIIPKYFVPKALNHLRESTNLYNLFVVGDKMFEGSYPADDNRSWQEVSENRKHAREEEQRKKLHSQ